MHHQNHKTKNPETEKSLRRLTAEKTGGQGNDQTLDLKRKKNEL